MKHKTFIVIILMLFLKVTGIAQIKMLSKSEALNDIDSLQYYIEEIHPNAYAYVSKDKMNESYEEVKKSINDSLTIYELYNYLTFIAAKYGDGHLSIIFPLTKWFKNDAKVIPFTIDIDITKKTLYVQETVSGINIPNISEIIEINGISAKKIIDTMLICQSGESIAFRTERVKWFFPQLLYSIYKMNNSFKVLYKHGEELIEKTLQGISYKEYNKLTYGGGNSIEYYSADFPPEIETCIIDFREFSELEKFQVFLNTTFKKIEEKGIKNLIIDIRDNSGGNSKLGDELFQYIAKEPFTQYGKTIMKVSRHLKFLWKDYFLPKGYIDSTMLDKVLSIPNGSVINPNEKLYSEEEDSLISLRENPLRFTGTVFLLTSPATFSSAADFAWCFKHYYMGKVIGEETGGWGVCYGDNVYAELPNSRIAINVSCKLFYNIGATDNDTHGVIPDYEIEAEKALEYTIKLIKNEK